MLYPLSIESRALVEARRKTKAEWTSEGNQNGNAPNYVRRSRHSVTKAGMCWHALSGRIGVKPGGTAGIFSCPS